MTDRLLLRGLTFHGHHGVSEAERDVGGRYVVDLDLECDLAPAGATDDLADTVNYAAVARTVVGVGTGESFRLVEALAEAMATAVLSAFPVSAVTVRVTKTPPPVRGVILKAAGVEIRRLRGTG